MSRIAIPQHVYLIIIVSLFLFETALYTALQGVLGVFASPILCLMVGIALGMVPLVLKPIAPLRIAPTPKLGQNVAQLTLAIAATVFAIGMFNNQINRHPNITAAISDIIPQMQVLSERFVNGEMPYQPITEWGYNMFPTYQPLQWLPFSIPALLGFDYRWLALAFWIGAVWLYQAKLRKEPVALWQLVVLSLIPFAGLAAFYQFRFDVLAYTVEILIAAYYIVLALSVHSRSVWAIAGGILLCLLSRYSVVLWLPLYFLVLLLDWDRKKTLQAAGLVTLGILVIYVLPFMTRDWQFFLKGYAYHTGAALGEWGHNNASGRPIHLFEGVGFACYFYEFAGGELMDRLKLAQKFHLGISLATVLLLAGLYFGKLRKHIPTRVFLLASLKIYLVVFYAFIQIPYTYLMVVPLFAGLPLLLPSLARGED